jgi:asparagine synthetase B (glutamine-hydrolysing)
LFDLPCPIERVQWLLYRCYREKCYGGNPERLLDHLNCFVSPVTLARHFGQLQDSLLDGLNQEALAGLPFLKQALLVDHVTYLNFLLERQDKASMGASMEARLPFLDQALVDYVMRLPPHLLVEGQHNKKPLKRMLARHLGEAFAYRPKVGFPLPIEQWLEQEPGLGRHWKRVDHDDFLLWQKADRRGLLRYLQETTFDRRQLSYGDSERVWFKWFLSVLAAAQEVFAVTDIA